MIDAQSLAVIKLAVQTGMESVRVPRVVSDAFAGYIRLICPIRPVALPVTNLWQPYATLGTPRQDFGKKYFFSKNTHVITQIHAFIQNPCLSVPIRG
jgi:hypothetical protein